MPITQKQGNLLRFGIIIIKLIILFEKVRVGGKIPWGTGEKNWHLPKTNFGFRVGF